MQPVGNGRVLNDELAGDKSQKATAGNNEDGKALDHPQYELRPTDDERHADEQTEDQQDEAALSCGCDAENVVDAHDQVGDNDGPDRRKRAAARLHLVACAFVLFDDQLDADPDEQQSADDLEVRELEQPDREERQNYAEQNRAQCAEDDTPASLRLGQIAAGERDDDGVVS